MEIFNQIVNFVAERVPDWVALFACPALLVLVTVILAVFGGKRAYWGLSVIVLGAGFFLVACKQGSETALLYLALCAVLCGVLRLVLFLPRPFGRKKKRGSREEKIYQKFREPLDYPAEPTAPAANRVEAPAVTAEECGMQLEYVSGLLGKLKAERLTAADRLEIEVLSRAIDTYRGKSLTESELGSLNDCLASVLKLTAKYQL